MARYYQSYDAFGERITILPIPADVPGQDPDFEAKHQAEVLACISADDLYDTMRHDGKSHDEARAAVKERFGL